MLHNTKVQIYEKVKGECCEIMTHADLLYMLRSLDPWLHVQRVWAQKTVAGEGLLTLIIFLSFFISPFML